MHLPHPVQIKDNDKCNKYEEENITTLHDETDYESRKGFIAQDYDHKWWIGGVLSTEEETDSEDNACTP
jgi:hypothetical protein